MARAKRVWKLPRNPVTEVEKPVQTHRADIEVFSSEEVWALVRRTASEQDAVDLPHRRVHRPAPRRARRPALARRRLRLRLRGPPDPRHRELHRTSPDDAEVRPRARTPSGPERGGSPRPPRPPRKVRGATTTSSSPESRDATSTPPRSPAATSTRSSKPASATSASAISATPSAPRSSATRTSPSSR